MGYTRAHRDRPWGDLECLAYNVDLLIFVPVLRLEPATIRALMALEWGGPLSILWQRDNPNSGPDARIVAHANHLYQYQRGRDLFLAGPYDAMLVIESDMIPPAHTIERLAALPGDLCYGCYRFRAAGQESINLLERYGGWPKQCRNIGEPLNQRGLYAAAVAKGVIDVSGSGLGCVLIRRPVLEVIPFERPPGGGFFDQYWTQEVYRAGFRMMADLSVQCGHVDPSGVVLWPG